jgi:putative ABC transport system permease protein
MRPEHWLFTIPLRLRSLLGRTQANQALDDELRDHLERKTEEYVARGMTQEEAHRRARLDLGGMEQTKEKCRDARRVNWIQDLIQDLRYGLRTLRKSPGFTAVAVLTLALGIGTNTIIFSIVHAVLLTPLPYRDSGRLVVIYDRETRATGLSKLMDLYHDFKEYREHSRSFDRVAGMTWVRGNPTLTGFGASKEVRQAQVTLDFFPLLGVPPALGRTFSKEDMARACTVVLAYPFWRDVLGGQEEHTIGGTIRLDDQACDVIGVMPQTFTFFPADTELWTLINSNTKFERDPLHHDLAIYAHLKPSVSIPAALAELTLLHAHGNEHRHAVETQPVVLPLQQELTWLAGANLRLSLIVLFSAVSALLLIACVNVANLLLTRSLSRQRELAIRTALGSGTPRLIRQLLTEGLLLSLSAATLGTFLAMAVIHFFNIAKPIPLPLGAPVRINAPVLLFTAGLSVFTTAFFGFVPAWKVSRIDVMEVLKTNSQSATQGAGHRTVGRMLIVAQVTLSLVLLTVAGLLIESVVHFASIPVGFAPDRVTTMTISLPPRTYAEDLDRGRVYERIFSRLDGLPGVQAIALSSAVPFRPIYGFDALEVEGQPPRTPETAHHDSGLISISPQYFAALGISLRAGRAFNADDQLQTEPVAIVNEALVKKYFDGEDPVGRDLHSFGALPEHNPWRRIVGVVADEKTGNPFQEMSWLHTPCVFLPVAQVPPARGTLLIRSSADLRSLGNIVQSQISRLDPRIPISNLQNLEQLLVKEHFAYPRFRALVVGCFAAFALLLAVIGLYGVLSQTVAQRTHEIGVRRSLGAEARRILGMVVKEGMSLVALGVGLGTATAWFLARFIGSLLYGVNSNDPTTLAVVSVFLLFAALAAILVPARRAMRVDPLEALRHE